MCVFAVLCTISKLKTTLPAFTCCYWENRERTLPAEGIMKQPVHTLFVTVISLKSSWSANTSRVPCLYCSLPLQGGGFGVALRVAFLSIYVPANPDRNPNSSWFGFRSGYWVRNVRLNCPTLPECCKFKEETCLSEWTGLLLLWSPLIYDSFRLERTLQIPISCQVDAKAAFTRYKNLFLSSNICNLSLFLVSPFPSPRSKLCSRDLHPRSLRIRHRFWEGGWRREFTQFIKKKTKNKKAFGVTFLCAFAFVLPLLRSLPALRAHFHPPLSLFIVQHPLCAWTLFIHELVNTSVNEGKRRFYRLALCVEEAVWTARAPLLERMSRPLSALRVLWPFPSLFSPIYHFTTLLSLWLPFFPCVFTIDFVKWGWISTAQWLRCLWMGSGWACRRCRGGWGNFGFTLVFAFGIDPSRNVASLPPSILHTECVCGIS